MPVKARAEDGFTMIMTVIGLTLVVLLAAVALTAVNGDAQLSGRDLARKQAYEAALAGINEYAFHLQREPNYWEKCTGAGPVGQPNALNLQGSTTNRRQVPGQPGATYALELLPAKGYANCEVSVPASLLEGPGQMPGTFRIRATGFVSESHVRVTATFKPASFLDYVYFTQRETSDPVTYGKQILISAATKQCSKKISEKRTETWLQNEAGEPLGASGEPLHQTTKNGKVVWVNPEESQEEPLYCDTISFVSGDNIQGPMRTNDVFVLCGSPTLGRNIGDAIIVSYPKSPGWLSTSDSILHNGSNCSGSEINIKGHYQYGQGDLIPPKSNQELKKIAEENGYALTGEVNICLQGSQILIGHGEQCKGTVKAYPPNGVIYVSSIKCSNQYSPFAVEYATEATGECGNVNVQGTFSKPLTIAAQNDILITGDLKKTNENEEGMLGLIANNFIRVKHPVKITTTTRVENGNTVTEKSCNRTSENLAGTMQEPTIEAAMLALEHSFIVDNYSCGPQLKNLNVTGAIAQYYRGAVGTTNSSGYLKHYVYDQRFEHAEPPYFLEPIQSDWVIGRETTE